MIPLPLHTARLVLRMFTDDDAPVLAAYRSDPDVARYQDWPMPYTTDGATESIRRQAHLAGPTVGESVQVAIEHDGQVIGDLYVGIGDLIDGSAQATLGYTLAATHQGRGFALEAAEAMVDAVFEYTPVHRIEATLDPLNAASMRVLDLLGFSREGVARRSVAIRGAWLDDLRYGLLREERAAWKARPRTAATVRFIELDADLVRTYGGLAVHPHQEQFVSSVRTSFGDALFPEVVDGAALVPWLRGIEAVAVDGAPHPAGFVMLAQATEAHPEPYLWRLAVDRWWQRAGVGRAVLDALVAMLRSDGHRALLVSWVDGIGGPRRFYERYGFVPTGRLIDGEIEARLPL